MTARNSRPSTKVALCRAEGLVESGEAHRLQGGAGAVQGRQDENFLTGFWVTGERRAEVWGRPAALAVTRDGALCSPRSDRSCVTSSTRRRTGILIRRLSIWRCGVGSAACRSCSANPPGRNSPTSNGWSTRSARGRRRSAPRGSRTSTNSRPRWTTRRAGPCSGI